MADDENSTAEEQRYKYLYDYALAAAMNAVFHPFSYVKVLIQVGHEPSPPYVTKTIFGRDRLIYPNIFRYMKHVKNVDGVSGLYRGLTPHLVGVFIQSGVQNKVSEIYATYLEKETLEGEVTADPNESSSTESLMENAKDVACDICRDCVAKCAGIVVSYPFHVIMLRSMAQFVGGESRYSSILSGTVELYKNDGIFGFFAGIVPRLMGEVLIVITGTILARSLKYIITDDLMDGKNVVSTVSQLVVSQIFYPFSLVSNVAAVSSSGLLACCPPHMPSYKGWLDIWSHFRKIGQLKRGSSMFWRFYHGPTATSGGVLIPVTEKNTDDFIHFRLHTS